MVEDEYILYTMEKAYDSVKQEIPRVEKEIRLIVKNRWIEFFRLILSFLLIFVIIWLTRLLNYNLITEAAFFPVIVWLHVFLVFMPFRVAYNLLRFLGGFGLPTFSRMNVGGQAYCYVREKQMREQQLQELYRKLSNLERLIQEKKEEIEQESHSQS